MTAVDDAIHDNEDYIQMVDPNRLGGVVARRALKLYVVKVRTSTHTPRLQALSPLSRLLASICCMFRASRVKYQ